VLKQLLDRYERSKHAKDGFSNRRVLLNIKNGDLPEYDYQHAEVRDVFNSAVSELESAGIVKTRRERNGLLISEIWLNLDNIQSAYKLAERKTQKELCFRFIKVFEQLQEQCDTEWIRNFALDQISEIQLKNRPTAICRRNECELQDLIKALSFLDSLHGESITMRAFSIGCFHDSKHFEKNVKELFLSVAKKHCIGLVDADENQDLGWRDNLIPLGIFARPELYELSGDITIVFPNGTVNLSSFGKAGVALPDLSTDNILHIDMGKIRQVIFIENKTCYDEYSLKLKQDDELVIYQGGFLSPKRARFVRKLAQSSEDETKTNFLFWGDIDAGGFKMYIQLRELISRILPWRMGAEDVGIFRKTGMKRSDAYFAKMDCMREDDAYSLFHDAILQLSLHHVTIEQESMLEALISDSQTTRDLIPAK
jgi:hypothetical protein